MVPLGDRVKELLRYNPCTGAFHWKVSRGGRRSGREAGSVSKDGYRRIAIDSKAYKASRLAWLYVYKELPNIIDHIDRKRSNDSIWNLSNGTQSDNMRNSSAYKHGLFVGWRKWRRV